MVDENDKIEKNIDETWKDSVGKQKDIPKEAQDDKIAPPFEVDFSNFVTSLGLQAMIFLGEIPNPISQKKEMNLPQAGFIIDTLAMLREKTKGNLTLEEANLLDNFVYELQMKFVEKNKGEKL